jgi:glycosyl hydrolase family 5/cellulase (glycosyl hydrolase family 5)
LNLKNLFFVGTASMLSEKQAPQNKFLTKTIQCQISILSLNKKLVLMPIQRDGIYFKDEQGRTRLLRGINLGGSSKFPTKPDGATHLQAGFFEHHDVSFIGRPFPLETADEHFQRLKAWGLDFLRLIVTWEAVEHCGAGHYDEAYLDYLVAIVDKAADYDILLFIDFHQDVWSRFTGGDGAPGWTLEAAGLDMRNFEATTAAIVHQTHGSPFPKMRWASNYSKLATGTMFTLFFAGNDFAPQTKIDDVSIQDYLQEHYINMLRQVVMRLKDKANVLGYDWMNEPSKGFIGLSNLGKLQWTFKHGEMPTPFQAMCLGEGLPQRIMYWTMGWLGMYPIRRHKVDPQGTRAWQEGVEGIWKQHGVWDMDNRGKAILLQADYFSKVNGREVDYARDYMRPFINRVAAAIHEIDSNAMIFVEFDAIARGELPTWQENDAKNIIYAPHWYDFVTLMSKHYVSWFGLDNVNSRPVFGHQNIRRTYANNLAHEKEIAQEKFGGVPTIIGEIGIPYDLNARLGYRLNHWQAHMKAIDDYMSALEANLLNATIWNYTADNSNQYGDKWNGEDLSIFSPDQQKDPSDINSGGRALEALLRPYPRATAGKPLTMNYDVWTGEFRFIFRHDEAINAPSEFYIPNLQYPNGYSVEISDGNYEIDSDNQRLYYRHSTSQSEHEIYIKPTISRPKPPPSYWIWLLMSGGIVALALFIRWFMF